MKTLTRADLVETLCAHLGFTRVQVEEIIENFFELMISCLERGEELRFSGFGNFLPIDKKSRPGRNPKTGVGVEIKSRRVVTFKSGNRLKGRIERNAQKLKNQVAETETV